ncbi:uncharacterized protein B0H18DRAFT_1030679 [Fomitopsis serialis]|uniref:uncharacterized protein n=1 Tax=Fomitopsis serialis TaxID=139415 RepID=UPI0020076E9D|nr:uncharacterized protein B0H18DRAFT_1030679 [Neoantrodia serialis]KAH9918607.1 hypothetical protein B0H18DRAFT_1030679 [Neoantrodia serialis]
MPLFDPNSESNFSPVLGLDATIRDDLGPQAMAGDTPVRFQLNHNAQLRHPVEHQLLASPNVAEKETQSYSAGNQGLASLGINDAISGSVSSATATSHDLASVRSYAHLEIEDLRLKLAESEIENKKINDMLAAREAVIKDLEEEGAQRRSDSRTLTMRLIEAEWQIDILRAEEEYSARCFGYLAGEFKKVAPERHGTSSLTVAGLVFR